MTTKTVLFTLAVLALPVAASADAGLINGFTSVIIGLPEPSTLGILGSGLIGLAVAIRRKLKLANATSDRHLQRGYLLDGAANRETLLQERRTGLRLS